VSIDEISANAAQFADGRVMDADLSSVFNEQTERQMEDTQRAFMERFLEIQQQQTVRKQPELSSVANANYYVNNTAFVGLRIR
jgi:predicted P-loop ATPase